CGIVLQCRVTSDEPAWVGPEVVEREQRLFARSALPICMLSFPAEHPTDDPAGEFRWIVGPRVQGPKAFLALNSAREFHPLTDERLAQVVRELTEWYAARSREDQLLAAGVHGISEHGEKRQHRRAD
ncbi:MAG TPA: hypothetical protein VFS20_25170, partial [Longimicrobium sp.]|nr:hypothetical protein [Longimicrobium sp.]